MYDWNGNGKYDSSDSYVDYHMASGSSGSLGSSSNWILYVLLAIVVGVCPPVGVIIGLCCLLFSK